MSARFVKNVRIDRFIYIVYMCAQSSYCWRWDRRSKPNPWIQYMCKTSVSWRNKQRLCVLLLIFFYLFVNCAMWAFIRYYDDSVNGTLRIQFQYTRWRTIRILCESQHKSYGCVLLSIFFGNKYSSRWNAKHLLRYVVMQMDVKQFNY